jgi:hypothetical protein
MTKANKFPPLSAVNLATTIALLGGSVGISATQAWAAEINDDPAQSAENLQARQGKLNDLVLAQVGSNSQGINQNNSANNLEKPVSTTNGTGSFQNKATKTNNIPLNSAGSFQNKATKTNNIPLNSAGSFQNKATKN